MSNQVSFKVRLLLDSEEEIRRFNIDRDVCTSLAKLQEKLASLFPNLRRRQFTLSWIDSEGDSVTLSSDDDLTIAMTEMSGPVYTFDIRAKEDMLLHKGVTCDNCQGEVRGFRYKCLVCPDFDLCQNCEEKGFVHKEHLVIRIVSNSDDEWLLNLIDMVGKGCRRIPWEAAMSAFMSVAGKRENPGSKDNSKSEDKKDPIEELLSHFAAPTRLPPGGGGDYLKGVVAEVLNEEQKMEEKNKGATASQQFPKEERIVEALKVMTEMGFTNDGGWLEKLLREKGGDIGKVMDTLNPHRN